MSMLRLVAAGICVLVGCVELRWPESGLRVQLHGWRYLLEAPDTEDFRPNRLALLAYQLSGAVFLVAGITFPFGGPAAAWQAVLRGIAK